MENPWFNRRQKIIPRLRIAEKLDIKKSGALQATDLKSAAVREKVVQIIGGRLGGP